VTVNPSEVEVGVLNVGLSAAESPARTKNGVIFDHVTLLFVTVFNAVESVTKPPVFTAFNRSFESPTLVVGVLLTVNSLV
jgi:hypothetical protein